MYNSPLFFVKFDDMIYLESGNNSIVLTLWELTTIEDPLYMLTLNHTQSNKNYELLLTDDLSIYPTRYNKYLINIPNDLPLEHSGDYTYKVYQLELGEESDYIDNVVVEVGRMRFKGDEIDSKTYDKIINDGEIYER